MNPSNDSRWKVASSTSLRGYFELYLSTMAEAMRGVLGSKWRFQVATQQGNELKGSIQVSQGGLSFWFWVAYNGHGVSIEIDGEPGEDGRLHERMSFGIDTDANEGGRWAAQALEQAMKKSSQVWKA